MADISCGRQQEMSSTHCIQCGFYITLEDTTRVGKEKILEEVKGGR